MRRRLRPPAVWDETVVLPESRIGRLSAFARRKGSLWMVAVMAGGEGATLRLPLGFLGEGAYGASIVHDVPGKPADVTLEERSVRRDDMLTVVLERGGGFVARLRPVPSDQPSVDRDSAPSRPTSSDWSTAASSGLRPPAVTPAAASSGRCARRARTWSMATFRAMLSSQVPKPARSRR